MKRGLSPIIASVILIGIVIILAGIVFFWANDFIVNFAPTSISCDEANFESGFYKDDTDAYHLDIVNNGNIALDGFVLKLVTEAELTVISEKELSPGLEPGGSVSIPVPEITGRGTGSELLVVPQLLEREILHACADQYGENVVLE